jgi:hypothetical protein
MVENSLQLALAGTEPNLSWIKWRIKKGGKREMKIRKCFVLVEMVSDRG